MLKKDRYPKILSWFEENQPMPQTELGHDSPFHLLVAVILSAQCTDRRVNMVTPPLFERFPNPEDLAAASFEEVLSLVKSVSYPNSKAGHLIEMAKKLVSDFGSEVPSDIDALMSLPGVGRKTANVIASIVYDKLEKNIPESQRAKAHHWLILHGRYTCVARKPKCDECGLRDWCREYERNNRKSL